MQAFGQLAVMHPFLSFVCSFIDTSIPTLISLFTHAFPQSVVCNQLIAGRWPVFCPYLQAASHALQMHHCNYTHRLCSQPAEPCKIAS